MGRQRKWPSTIYHHKPTHRDVARVWINGKPKDYLHDSDEAREAYRRLIAEFQREPQAAPTDARTEA
jgi:hypothetical protein